jgi:hypothetical protein
MAGAWGWAGDGGEKSQKHSTGKPDAKNKRSSSSPSLPTCPECMVRPQGVGPWVAYWDAELNGNWPYWEALANLEPAPAPAGGMVLKAAVRERRKAGVMPNDEKPGDESPAEAPPPRDKPPGEEQSLM